jgi:hypothetical protein
MRLAAELAEQPVIAAVALAHLWSWADMRRIKFGLQPAHDWQTVQIIKTALDYLVTSLGDDAWCRDAQSGTE